jgi:hypothetical protein
MSNDKLGMSNNMREKLYEKARKVNRAAEKDRDGVKWERFLIEKKSEIGVDVLG